MRPKTDTGMQSVDLKVHVLEETVDTGEEWVDTGEGGVLPRGQVINIGFLGKVHYARFICNDLWSPILPMFL